MKFNTAIAAMMSLINEISDAGSLTNDELGIFARLLCPFAPHLCEEIWESLGNAELCARAPWPEYDEAKTVDSTVEIAVQVNGKVRAKLMVPSDASKEDLLAAAKADPAIAAQLAGKTIVKEIAVPGKLVNIAVKG
jgi:leucyl-tRNA synthetase